MTDEEIDRLPSFRIKEESNVVTGKKAMKGMMKGISIATEAIRMSYGPSGCNAAVENEFYPFHMVANDAQTIIQAIQAEGKLEKRGLAFLKELSDKANKDSGDGRKTTCIIAEEILKAASSSGISGISLKKELDSLIPFIETKINERKKTISEAGIGAVAAIAGESEETGRLLQEIYERIGKDGIIIPEASDSYSTSWSVIEGVRLAGTGYLSPYMAHDEDARKDGRPETKAVYENPIVLVTKRKIEKDSEIASLIDASVNTGKPLVIFTDDMDSGVAFRMIATHKAKAAKLLIIKAPVLWKGYVFEDFAKVTGSTIVEDAAGVNFKNLQMSHLGTCEKLIVDKDETLIIGGADISGHIASLRSEGSSDSKLRLSWLATKTCILKLGANSESELSYIRLKCEDAINSSRLALRDGTVEGGGKCLDSIADEMPDTAAGNILRTALKAPLAQNLANMGKSEADWGEEILDAAAVAKNAVRNAISLASTILTTGIVISFPDKTPEQIAAEAMRSKGIRF